MGEDGFPLHVDERGRLLAIELGDVPFTVQRVFVVHGAESRSPRGDHEVPCEQLAVLLSGSARFDVSFRGHTERTVLDRPGQRLRLSTGHHVRYVLAGSDSAILVLAAAAYEGPS